MILLYGNRQLLIIIIKSGQISIADQALPTHGWETLPPPGSYGPETQENLGPQRIQVRDARPVVLVAIKNGFCGPGQQ